MRISVDGSRIRNNKVAFSNLSGIVWTGPKFKSKSYMTNTVQSVTLELTNMLQSNLQLTTFVQNRIETRKK